MYHCFGCGLGGNVFTFLMEFEKVSFVEAVRSLAEKAGIALPEGRDDSQAASEQEVMYEVLKEAGRFYHRCLTESPDGKAALDYLRSRRFSDQTIRTFGLGYSPHSWDAFLTYAEGKTFPTALLVKCGLARQRDDGTHFDYFRGRVMFPVFTTTGRVAGFGARKIREDDPLGKYINSPETPVYNKSRLLYGLFQAKEEIRQGETAILVEGYADLISLFQSGIKNVVASSGTSLTGDQITLLGRYTRNITIVYDADSAGSQAALRGVDAILEQDLDVQVASLPEGEDPDSFVKAKGPEEFRKLIREAVSFIDFIALTCERQNKLATPEGQAQTVRTIVGSIAKMKDELKRSFYIKRVADKYRLYESTLYRELEKLQSPRGSRRQDPQRLSEPSPARETGVPQPEKDLIGAMVQGGTDTIRYVFSKISLEDFSHPDARGVAALLIARAEAGESLDPNSVIDDVKFPSQRGLIAEAVLRKYPVSQGWKGGSQPAPPDTLRAALGAITALRRRILENSLQENQRQLKDAARRGIDLFPYLERNRQILGEIKELEPKP